jgi:hypothetical protein
MLSREPAEPADHTETRGEIMLLFIITAAVISVLTVMAIIYAV